MTHGEYEGMLFRLRQIGENEAADLIIERTYYRDMWLAQRVENENFRKQLGLVAVSDEAERELSEEVK
jgi:hypothetical protein